ncbi:uncharacterized protein LOC111621214 [Centruroides sculpturatus]|uniref:uncharacterized protein LOC111621214 n=1 Tax=Centruroides sculpturatus TaxID=218467 RepID=UPI000C6DAAC6|nr:uncharacterized protein LOC111621214 [Centruroides sculpturatus]
MSRRSACFVLSVVQTVCGCCLLILTALKAKFQPPAQPDVNSYAVGVFCSVAGMVGAAAYNPRRSSDHNRVRVLFYALSCAFLLFSFDSVQGSCPDSSGNDLDDEKSARFSLLLIKLLLSYGTRLAALLGVAFSCPELKSFLAEERVDDPSSWDKPGGKQYVRLPEATRHVQEAQGTGEKILVVTLPFDRKVVYAVPDDGYVIRRQGAYVAPAGNSRLTAFFPSYNKFETD